MKTFKLFIKEEKPVLADTHNLYLKDKLKQTVLTNFNKRIKKKKLTKNENIPAV